jgi:hypothetical protein
MEVPGKVFLSKCRLTGLILRYGIKYDHKNIFSTQGANPKKLLRRQVTNFRNRLECLPLASLSGAQL